MRRIPISCSRETQVNPAGLIVCLPTTSSRRRPRQASGRHTFRHTYSTLLHALGTAPAVQKELRRHSDIQTTLNIYTQAVTSAKREAASKVEDLLWRM